LFDDIINEAKNNGINVMGPSPADTIFVNAMKGFNNGITTMYHDQGQIALKLMNFESSVTIIAGLSCSITTPAHGTMYDIVGKGITNAKAMEQAIKIAAEMAKRIGTKI
jgi:4-hydroxy-L-threonine phosphate dehydrogenase PdxA